MSASAVPPVRQSMQCSTALRPPGNPWSEVSSPDDCRTDTATAVLRRSTSYKTFPRAPSDTDRPSFQIPRRCRTRSPLGLPIAFATAQRISQSDRARPTGWIAFRTRWMRRSAFMNVPSFSNEEHAGRNTDPNSRAVSLRKISCTITFQRRERSARARGVGIREEHVVADRPQRLELSVERSIHHLHQLKPGGLGSGWRQTRSIASRPASRGVDPGSTVGSQPMWAAPWTLFWPRSGFTPLPALPMLPVSSARLTSAMTPSVPCTCSVIPSPWTLIDGPCVAYSLAASRIRFASTPQISAARSGVQNSTNVRNSSRPVVRAPRNS